MKMFRHLPIPFFERAAKDLLSFDIIIVDFRAALWFLERKNMRIQQKTETCVKHISVRNNSRRLFQTKFLLGKPFSRLDYALCRLLRHAIRCGFNACDSTICNSCCYLAHVLYANITRCPHAFHVRFHVVVYHNKVVL